jgi:hypothetical protein
MYVHARDSEIVGRVQYVFGKSSLYVKAVTWIFRLADQVHDTALLKGLTSCSTRSPKSVVGEHMPTYVHALHRRASIIVHGMVLTERELDFPHEAGAAASQSLQQPHSSLKIRTCRRRSFVVLYYRSRADLGSLAGHNLDWS